MADRPVSVLDFAGGDCADCGPRRTAPETLPVRVRPDIDLSARDFEGFRRVMLESLALDNPDRNRWSEADLEVVLVELLAAALDRLSFSVDTVFAERFLETAQWPRSVVRLLTMIDGIAPAATAIRGLLREDELSKFGFQDTSGNISEAQELYSVLDAHPQLLPVAKAAALHAVDRVEACITLEDLGQKLREFSVFAHVQPRHVVEGGRSIYEVAVLLQEPEWSLPMPVSGVGVDYLRDFIEQFRNLADRAQPPDAGEFTTGSIIEILGEGEIESASIRTAVTYVINPLLPLSTRLRLVDGQRAGIYMRLCVDVAENYFRSEVESAVRAALSNRPGAFFDQTHFGFGEALAVSDIHEALSALDGVKGVVISRIQIVGDPGSEASTTGILIPGPNQALTLDANKSGPEFGYYVLKMSGGLIG